KSYQPSLNPKGYDVYEAPIRPTMMTDQQRHLFVQKAKADRLAFDCAQLLSRGETSKAATMAGECMTIAGREQLVLWLRHYAANRIKDTSTSSDELLHG